MLRIRNSRWGVYLFDFWVLGFSAFAIWTFIKANDAASEAHRTSKATKHLAVQNANRIADNQKRINEIQAARVASCRATYEGVRKVFKPFITDPKNPQVIKFNNRIDELKKACPTQTRVKKERG